MASSDWTVSRVFSRSAALACAPYTCDRTVLRILPKRSGCQVASNGSVYSVKERFAEELEPPPPPEPTVKVLSDADCRIRVIEGFVLTVGKYWERASSANARAEKKLAADAAIFWFDMLTWSSSAFSCGSLKISHHF